MGPFYRLRQNSGWCEREGLEPGFFKNPFYVRLGKSQVSGAEVDINATSAVQFMFNVSVTLSRTTRIIPASNFTGEPKPATSIARWH